MSVETIDVHENNPETKRKVLSFLFVDHSQRKQAEITRQIAESNADTILLELVGSPQETRDRVESAVNAAISAKNLNDRIAYANGLSQGMRDLIWALAGSGKQIHFIDVAENTPEYQLIRRARSAREDNNYEQLFAESVAAREAVVEAQINGWREAVPDSNILVVMGAMHGRITDRFSGIGDVTYSEADLKEKAQQRLSITQ